MAVTIYDIAKATGFSITTVSKVLNNYPDEDTSQDEDISGDTFVVNDKAIETVENNQSFKVKITDGKVIKVMLSKKQLDLSF